MSITTNIEVDKVCRTCLIPSEDMKSLYEACSSAMQICVAEVLSKCTSLKMSVANDGLPTHICQDCLCKLNQAYNFVLKCRKSDDKLRNHRNKNINTSAAVQITHTDGICVKTEEAAIINYLNTNMKLEVDLTLGISDSSIRQESVNTLEDGRCSGNDFKSPNLNDGFECINDFKISLREPLPISAIQTDLNQELVFIKHEIDCDVETEMQRSINYRNEDIYVDRASVNLHENATEPKPCRQSSTLQPEIEKEKKITSVHTEAKNTLSVNSIEFKKSHNMNSVNTDKITSNQPENAMNMMNAVVILEDINLHLKSFRSPIQHQFEQLNSAVSKSINKIAIIADTSSIRPKISQIRRDHQTAKINDQYCTKMPVKPYRVKRNSKCTAIYTTEETLKSTISRLRNHQVYIPYTCKFTCTVCEKCFNNKQELRFHIMTHTRESLSPPDVIVKSITRKESGPRHVKHMGDKSTVCKICEKTFIRKSGLNQHLLTHTGEKPHSCATCDRGFIQKGDLTRHMLIHTGERPYSCSVCDKTFTQKGSLTLHTFIHTGERPYSCGTCDKKFIQKVDLTRHMLIHTGEKPYSCPNCDKTFTRKDRLTKHMLIEIDQRKCVNSG